MGLQAKITKHPWGLTSDKAAGTLVPGKGLQGGPRGEAGSVCEPNDRGLPPPFPGVPRRVWVLPAVRLWRKGRSQENTPGSAG